MRLRTDVERVLFAVESASPSTTEACTFEVDSGASVTMDAFTLI